MVQMSGAPGVTRTPGTQSRNRSGGTTTSMISRPCVCKSRQVAAENATQAHPAIDCQNGPPKARQSNADVNRSRKSLGQVVGYFIIP